MRDRNQPNSPVDSASSSLLSRDRREFDLDFDLFDLDLDLDFDLDRDLDFDLDFERLLRERERDLPPRLVDLDFDLALVFFLAPPDVDRRRWVVDRRAPDAVRARVRLERAPHDAERLLELDLRVGHFVGTHRPLVEEPARVDDFRVRDDDEVPDLFLDFVEQLFDRARPDATAALDDLQALEVVDVFEDLARPDALGSAPLFELAVALRERLRAGAPPDLLALRARPRDVEEEEGGAIVRAAGNGRFQM
jgi:hypothetical protein